MDVQLPDGSILKGVPDGTTKDQIVQKLQASGREVPQEWLGSKEPKQRGLLAEAGRQTALAGRAVVQGAGKLAALPSDAIFGTINAIQQMRGKPKPYKLASETISEGLDKVGLPKPETSAERFTTAVEEGLGSGGGGIAAGRAILGGVPAVTSAVTGSAPALSSWSSPLRTAIGQGLASAPAAQATGALTGPTAATAAAALGAPAPVQTLAGLIGGAAGGAGTTALTAAGRGARALVTPATEAGRRVIAGNVLRTAATHPENAASRLAQTRENVPGSSPTTGEAAGDTGLAYFQQRLRGISGSEFNARSSQQNAARQALLDSVARGGETPAIESMVTRRDNVTRGMRDTAFAEAQGKPVQTNRILADIDTLLSNPENAGKSVQDALKSIRSQISGKDVATTKGDIAVQESKPLTDARSLYAVRKEINRIMEGRYIGADESVLRYAGSQLKSIRDSIDREISAIAPSWQRYLTKYAQLSRPIERSETVRDIRQRTSTAAPDISTGRDFLSQAKWKSVVDRAMPDLQQTMTRGQITKLNRITADLDRGAAAVAAGKVSGSDTAANLTTSGQISVAYVLSRALGGGPKNIPPALGSATRPLSFLYKLPDESIKELIVQAMLDPRLAEQLITEGTPANVRNFAAEFARTARGGAIGGSEASTGQQ